MRTLRQTKNVEAEHRCCEIGLRAERKAGELLQQTERAKGGRPASYDLDYKNQSIDTSGFDTPSREMGSPKPLIDLDISRDQSSQWQKLAGVPLEKFEAALAAPEKPTTTSIISAASPARPDPVSPEALWLWDETGQIGDGRLDPHPEWESAALGTTGEPAGNPDHTAPGATAPSLARTALAQLLRSPPL